MYVYLSILAERISSRDNFTTKSNCYQRDVITKFMNPNNYVHVFSAEESFLSFRYSVYFVEMLMEEGFGQ